MLPLSVVFLCRLPFPDLSFDVVNYHHVYAERTLGGAQFIAGDFFPYVLALNPAPDTFTALFRHLLGYRFGTVVGLFALIWTAAILFRMLRSHVGNTWIRAAAVLAILVTEQMLLLAGSYMVDVLALPLVLEATHRVLEKRKTAGTIFDVAYVALLLGVACAFKLTNLAFAIPIAGVYLFAIFRERSSKRLVSTSFFGAVFVLPLVAHAVYLYLKFGNPIFPAYNALFRSPYFPPINFRDGRFGPASFIEAFVFPFTSLWQAERLNELQIYSGRVALGLACAIACLWIARRDRSIFTIALVTILSALLWSLSTGYGRYFLALEIYCGLSIVFLIVSLTSETVARSLAPRIAAASVMIAFSIQLTFAGYYFFGHDWSGRLTAFHNPRDAWAEMRYFMRDYDLRKFQTGEQQKLFEQVDAWIISDIKTAGIEVLLQKNAAFINVYAPEFFEQPNFTARTAVRALFDRTLAPFKDRRMYSMCYEENLDLAISRIERAGLRTGTKTPMRLRVFSDLTVQNMVIIEVLP